MPVAHAVTHRDPSRNFMIQHRKPSIMDKFEKFHRENPHIYAALRLMSIQLEEAGFQRWSMKGLFEALRYQQALKTRGESFKLNNNYTALYARLLMDNEPRLEGFFEIRQRRAW